MERRWKVLIVVSVAVFMASLDLFIVNIAFPSIERDFHGAGVASVSWVLNGYSIVYAALLVPAGRIADRIGRRRMFLVGLIAFVIGSALCGSAPSVVVLVAARLVQAGGAACLTPTSLALLLPEFEPAQRPAAIGIWAAVGGVAAALGPPLGGLLVEANWRWVFWVNVPIGLIAALYARRILAESRDENQSRPDLLAAVILTAAVGLLSLGLVKGTDWGWASAATMGSLLAAALGVALFWWRCFVHPSPVVDPSMLRVRSFALANLASLAFSASFAAMLLGNVLYMTDVWHYSVIKAGLLLAPGPAMAATFAAPMGRQVARIGQRVVATTGVAIFTAGTLTWLLWVGATPHYASELLPGLIITGVGVGFVLPSLASAASTSLPPARFATGSAVYTMSRQLGFTLGVAVLVAVLGTVDPANPVRSFDRGWLFMVIAGTIATVAAFGIGRIAAPATVIAPLAAAAPLGVEVAADAL